VRHIAEVIDEAVQARQLRVRIPNNAIATYHDPCHLSRYADVTAAPRAVIRAVGLTLVEMERHGAASFCCGAGGGRIWMTDQGDAERPAIQRMREALKIPGLRYFVVACPKDLSMFRDAAKALVPDGSVQVRDLIELLDEAVGETA
jgi:Fe-S oxidoreductase